ncbi:MAG TPA: EamA family transporter [Candidatus Acidoferrales bacterium]|nr:EamA family transporter [Candidatus Acidoferrales bacterium]
MDWKILAIITPITFVTYQSIAKLLPKTISIFLVNAVAFFIGAIVMILLHLLLSPDKALSLSSKSLLIAVGIGILLSLGNFGIIKTLSLGAPQSTFSVLFYITLLIYGVIFGLLFWHETINLPQILGMLLSVAGIVILFYFKK